MKNVCFACYTACFDDKYVFTQLSNQSFEDGGAGDNAAGHLENIIMQIMIICSNINLDYLFAMLKEHGCSLV